MARFFINFDYIISTKYDKSVLNILCMTYLVTSSVAVFEAAIRVKSTHLIKSCLKARKKRKRGNKTNSYTNLYKRSFRHRIHSLLRRADAKGNADIIYRI